MVLILEMKIKSLALEATNKLSENELLAYENGLLLCLEKMLGTNRIKLGLGWKKEV